MKFLLDIFIILLCLIISGSFNTTYQTIIKFGNLTDNSACCCSMATVCSCSCTGGCCSPVITGVSYTVCDMNEIKTIPASTFEFVTGDLQAIFVFPEKLSYINEILRKKSVNYIIPIEKPPQKSL
ncbi:MAG: hypothetical protein KAS18_09995 [Calditrichia bacterium]|nr:hypothetical protein [Calditrichia bacterium]